MYLIQVKNLVIGITLLTLSVNVLAKSYPEIYPFVPFEVNQIHKAVKKVSEDPEYIQNFNDIITKKLSIAKTKVKPWTSTYWPLNRGLIADPYESSLFGYYIEVGTLSWTENYKDFIKRKNELLRYASQLSEKQLLFLSPSEKYDLLIGDQSFDLTNRLWDFMQTWGNQKEYGFLSQLYLVGVDALKIAKQMVAKGWYKTPDEAFATAYQLRGSLAVENALYLVKSGEFDTVAQAMPAAIEMALKESQNYVLEKKNTFIAFWEGICHGWSTAAGIVPRPRKTISFTLPDGRNLKFYPTDIKALISLLWANSLVQDLKIIDETTGKNIGGGVIAQGLRCNLKNPKIDDWGRYYDDQPDPFNGDHSPRCIGVHPAIWHLGLVNLIGKQGRSFVVERKVNEEVDNHPMYSYKMYYYHPYKGKFYNNINANIASINSKDKFEDFRSPQAKYIIGVKAFVTYIDWKRPQRFFNDNESYDKTTTVKMYYDLELDENYNIVGGQWRPEQSPTSSRNNDQYTDKGKYNTQPDFFWVITKDYKKFFQEVEGLEPWADTTLAPPRSWITAAKEAHSFKYQQKFKYGTGKKCRVYNQVTHEYREVSCEFEVPMPQPLLNVINVMIERAK